MDKEKYLRALELRDAKLEEVSKLNDFITECEKQMQEQFQEGFEPENIEIDSNTFYTKNIGKSTSTDNFVENIKTSLETNFGEKGSSLFFKAQELGTTTRTSFNKTKFEKGLKDVSKEAMLDITELIKAAEEQASEKTINYKLVKVKED